MARRASAIDAGRLDETLRGFTSGPGAELSGLAVALIDGGETVFEGGYGRRRIDPDDGSRDLPVEPDTKFRVASISKPVTALGAMALAERGLFDLDRDLSDYLGFELRNPGFPGAPITAAMLLSHTSSLRDRNGYLAPLPYSLEDFARGRAGDSGPMAWAAPVDGRDCSPGRYYRYANLGYPVLATVMERVSGERFDRYMRRAVLGPLGLDASFNVLDLSDSGFAKLATLYRKAGPDGAWDSAGPWVPQMDDYRGARPAVACRVSPGLGPEALEAYRVGTNGSIFSPQGGLRISARDLAKVARLFIGKGEVDGLRLLSRGSVERMLGVRWAYDADRRNGELGNGITRATGLGLALTTASRDEQGGDRLLEGGGPRLWGHHGDAYGLLGGVLFEPEEGWGYVYLIGGVARKPERRRGAYSSWFSWEEELQATLLGALGRGGPASAAATVPAAASRTAGDTGAAAEGPYRTGLWRWSGALGELGCFWLQGAEAEGDAIALDPGDAETDGGEFVGRATSPVLETPFPVLEAIPSWNGGAPEGTRLDCFLRARLGGVWTRWYAMGEWCESADLRARRSIDAQADEDGDVRTDTLVLARPADALQLRMDLRAREGGAREGGAREGGARPSIRNLALAFSSAKSSAARSARPACSPGLRGRVVGGVPAFSQMVYPDGGSAWCSPTCVAMILARWGAAGGAEELVRAAAAGVYDSTWGGCGNWSFNVAWAGTRGCDALVARFASLASLEPLIEAGIPVALSVSWDEAAGRPLAFAPLPRSAGHLTLLVGFDGAGEAVVHEPAAPDPSSVRRSYPRAELEARWLESSGGAAYVIAPRGRALPHMS